MVYLKFEWYRCNYLLTHFWHFLIILYPCLADAVTSNIKQDHFSDILSPLTHRRAEKTSKGAEFQRANFYMLQPH